MSDTAALIALIEQAAGRVFLCVGDLMLDRYVYGAVSRISPEAPIPVLRHQRSDDMPGAAGNVARNLAALGGQVKLVGAVGEDAAALRLREVCAQNERIKPDFLGLPTRCTTVKSRFVAGGQQILRLDEEDSSPLTAEAMRGLIDHVLAAIESVDAVLVSDYAKGVVEPALMQALVPAARKRAIPVIVDPKGRDFLRYGAVDLIKPNAGELAAAIGMPTGTDAEVEDALRAAKGQWPVGAILVTRAEKGLSFLDADGRIVHLRGEPVEVYDVSGAGDTSLAALSLGIAARAPLEDAARLALAASRLAVTRRGTVAIPAEDLRRALLARPSTGEKPEPDLGSVMAAVARWREEGRRVGFTNGCFDILHPGHLRVLEEARARCDRLVVGLNSDASVKRLKGASRPVNTQADRARMLLGLSVVDAVAVFEEDTPLELVNALKPDLLVKGGDYTVETIVGAREVIGWGGEVHVVPLVPGQSTTSIIERAGKDA